MDKDLPEAHPAIAPLDFLLGRWEGYGKGDYPTIEAFDFIQEVSFTHNGKPFLIYSSKSWLKETDADGNVAKGRPLGMETGFWRPQPNGEVEVVLAHPTGITEIYLGRISSNRVDLITDAVARTMSAKEVTGGKRLYGLIDSPSRPGEKDLAYAYDMAAMGQPLQPHLWAQLEWAWTELFIAPGGRRYCARWQNSPPYRAQYLHIFRGDDPPYPPVRPSGASRGY